MDFIKSEIWFRLVLVGWTVFTFIVCIDKAKNIIDMHALVNIGAYSSSRLVLRLFNHSWVASQSFACKTSVFGSISFVWPSIRNYTIAFHFRSSIRSFYQWLCLVGLALEKKKLHGDWESRAQGVFQLKRTKWNANNFQFSYNANNKSCDTIIKFKSQQIECSVQINKIAAKSFQLRAHSLIPQHKNNDTLNTIHMMWNIILSHFEMENENICTTIGSALDLFE